MFERRIGFSIAAAIMSLGAMARPWGNEPAPAVDPTSSWSEGKSRYRGSTRSNKLYFHRAVQMEQVHRDHTNGIEWVDRWAEANRPMRRAERKGINTVPRAPVSSLHAICF